MRTRRPFRSFWPDNRNPYTMHSSVLSIGVDSSCSRCGSDYSWFGWVGVVLHPHFASQERADVAIERVAVQRDRVRVLHQSGRRADHARNADADAGGDAELGFDVTHQGRDAFQRGLVAVRRIDAMAQAFAAVRCQHRDLDLGAAEVDADAVHGVRNCRPAPRRCT
jgi:hypothetical protein